MTQQENICHKSASHWSTVLEQIYVKLDKKCDRMPFTAFQSVPPIAPDLVQYGWIFPTMIWMTSYYQ